MNNKVIQMKIWLDEIEPLIWRRFIVSDSITLHKLHEIIQIVMGWANVHLYWFEINNKIYEVPDKDNLSELWGPVVEPSLNSKKFKLSELDLRPNKKIKYLYDMGDTWYHTILIEKILEGEKIKTPFCIDGERSAPPEDCGSVPGYERILKALRNKKKSKEDKELLEWVGDYYDPERFDIEDVNEELRPKRSRKPRLKIFDPNE